MRVTKVKEALDMTPQELAEALESIPMLEHWIKAVKAHAFDTIKQGGAVPGWKLGYGVRKRIWQDGVESQLLAALAKIGVPRDEVFTRPELLSPPKIEEHLKFRKLFPIKPRGGERPPSAIDPFVTKSMPEMSLVRANEEAEPEMRMAEASREFK